MAPGSRTTALVAAAVVGIDSLTKVAAVALLDGRRIELPLGLGQLRLYRNPGAVRGLLEDHTLVVTLISSVVVAGAVVVSRQARNRLEAVGFGLLVGGGMGNLVDRLARAPGPFQGHVVDWLSPWFSRGVMNLADLSLQAGMVALAVSGLAGWRQREPSSALRS